MADPTPARVVEARAALATADATAHRCWQVATRRADRPTDSYSVTNRLTEAEARDFAARREAIGEIVDYCLPRPDPNPLAEHLRVALAAVGELEALARIGSTRDREAARTAFAETDHAWMDLATALAHYETAALNWSLTLDERDDLRARRARAEATLVRFLCPRCAASDWPEYQPDPRPTWWHDNLECPLSAAYIAADTQPWSLRTATAALAEKGAK